MSRSTTPREPRRAKAATCTLCGPICPDMTVSVGWHDARTSPTLANMNSIDLKPNLDPSHGLTREECDALRADLEAAGVPVVRIDEPSPGVFWLVYRSPRLRVEFTLTNAVRFLETVRAGL